jgi:hypothetical protein
MGKLQDERMAVAKAVSMAVEAKIKLGAPNIAEHWGDKEQSKTMNALLDEVRIDAGLAAKTAREALGPSAAAQMAYFRMVKNSAKGHGVADCGEYTGYVMWRLYKKGVFPIHYIGVESVEVVVNHAFVAIGLESEGTKQYIDAWTDQEVAICDPWLAQLIRTGKTPLKAKAEHNTSGAFTPEEYIALTADLFRRGTRVDVVFGLDKSVGEIPKLKPGG